MNTLTIRSKAQPISKLWLSLLVSMALAFGCVSIASAQDKAEVKKPAATLSLITDTPEEGFALAIKLSQRGVSSVQKDPAVRKELRPEYDHEANSLIAISHVIATHFQTISAANNYWK